jgi:predicted nucleic acid-binding protein
VINASPLILLGKMNQLDLFLKLASRHIVPAAVIQEISAGVGDISTNKTVEWATRFAAPDIVVPTSVLNWDIGAGESQVLAHCLATNSKAILDDGAARAAAKAHDVNFFGSLGIILQAKKKGIILAARPLIDELVNSGSYLSAAVISEALRKVGESR